MTTKQRFKKFFDEFLELREKYGFTRFYAMELDTHRKVHGPYFGCSKERGEEDILLISFSQSGENGCPCCKRKEEPCT
jgi:hypothetical protein